MSKLSRKGSSDLDKFFNDSEIESALNSQHRVKGNLKTNSHNVQGFRKVLMLNNKVKANQNPPDRQLRQLKKKKSSKKHSKNYFKLEFRSADKKDKSKVRDKKISLRSLNKSKSKKLHTLKKDELLIKMVMRIKKNAKKRKLKIKRVLLGDRVKSQFKDHKLARHFSKYLNMSNLKSQFRKVKKSIKREKRKLRSAKKAAKKTKAKADAAAKKSRGLAGMGSTSSGGSSSSGGGKGKDNLMKFNFLPGFAGMPFPPFMMNGPHFHPPLNVTVNSLPNPNPRAELDPKEIEEENVKTQLKALNPIEDKLSHVFREIDSISKESAVTLEDKYQRVLQLNA